MKIKIVVRPEDEQKAAAEAARQARQKRGRWGIAALLGLVALSAAIALFFIGRGTPPDDQDEPPVASAPGSTGSAGDAEAVARADGTGAERSAADAAGAMPQSGGETAVDEGTSARGEPALPPPLPGAPAASTHASPGGTGNSTRDATGNATGAAPGAVAGGPEASKPAPTAGVAEAPGPSPTAAGGPEAPKPAQADGGEAANAPALAKGPAAKPGAGVVRAELASDVVNREPKGLLRSPVDVGARGRTVFYFNELRNLNGQTLTHRWEYNGRVMATIPIRIEGNRWRVYSSKRIGQKQLGDWRVSTVDKSGAVLAQAQFRAE
ncbi:MAG: DUF2914 domain-containing protein [Rhodospirillales bacterium]|nr:DUF2914 domain-containing protein [Rhodospirillales bacterium]